MTAQPVQVDRAALAAAVATALARVPGVARLSPGTGVEVATQVAGGKVVGVAVRDDTVVAHLVVDRLDLVIDDVDLDRLPPTSATGWMSAGAGVPAAPPTRRM